MFGIRGQVFLSSSEILLDRLLSIIVVPVVKTSNLCAVRDRDCNSVKQEAMCIREVV